MNYEDTKALMYAIDGIETFTKSMQRQIGRDDTDWDEYNKCEKWALESKQVILDLFNKLSASKESV
tara:strand:- start:281 stop:478 length:198 start_codon:yes stop_codon:yes gene_type:complete